MCDLPLIDYHNHLDIHDLARDRHYRDIAELWLTPDPYKHRAMRICGICEERITGNADPADKFRAWSETVPRLVGNPLYDWTMLELARGFGIETELNPGSAAEIRTELNRQLGAPEFSARGLLRKFKVEYAAPCAAATDDLTDFERVDGVVPSLRGDSLTQLDPTAFAALSGRLGAPVDSAAAFRAAVSAALDGFHAAGCRFADHALDGGFVYRPDDGRNDRRFAAGIAGIAGITGADETDRGMLQSEILRILASEYAARNWTLQLHIGAQRQTSDRLRQLAGPAGGYAGIGRVCDIASLTAMLNDFERGPAGLPRVILYTLNPADNAPLTVLTGSYTGDGIAGKVQAGPAWWLCDHLYGMRECFEHTAVYGTLSTAIGMTTDSRSLLSFTRHEYFRRAFCGWLGEKAQSGYFPAPAERFVEIAEAVCYQNAHERITRMEEL